MNRVISAIVHAALVAGVLCAAALAGAPVASAAEVLAISDPGQGIRGAALTMRVWGSSDEGGSLSVMAYSDGGCTAGSTTSYAPILDGSSTVAKGPFERTATLKAPAAGTWSICGVLRDRLGRTTMTADRLVTVREAQGTIALEVSGNATENDPLQITATGNSETARQVRVLARSQEGPCPAAPSDAPAESWLDVLDARSVAAGPGAFSVSGQFRPLAASLVVICGYLSDPGSATAPFGTVAAAVTSTLTSCCAAAVPTLSSPLAEVPFGRRVTFAWSGEPADHESVWVWAGATPGEPSEAFAHVGPDAGDEGSGPVEMRRILPLGEYSWVVTRQRGAFPAVTSAPGRFRVVPAPLRSLNVRKHRWGSRRVTASFRIVATPYSQVSVRVEREGRRIRGRRYTQQPRADDPNGKALFMAVRSTCRRPGKYRLRVVARDRGGHELRRTRTWVVRSCAFIRAREIAAARRRAEAERRAAARWAAEEAARQRRAAARIERFKSDCRAIGGSPRWLSNGYLYCIGPLGGPMRVPGW